MFFRQNRENLATRKYPIIRYQPKHKKRDLSIVPLVTFQTCLHSHSHGSKDVALCLRLPLVPHMSHLMTKPTKWLCTQRSLRSAWAQWVAKNPSFLHADSEDWSDWADAQADLSHHWAHMSFYRFCHVPAHIVWANIVLALVRLYRWAGLPEPSLLAYVISTIFTWAGSYTALEPLRDKTNNVAVQPAKIQICLGIRPVWSVFAVGSIGS